MIEAEVLPLAVSDQVKAIAGEAIHAAFAEIGSQLEALGYPVTGDVSPGEVAQLEDAFIGYVLAMCLNNPTIAAMQEPDRA